MEGKMKPAFNFRYSELTYIDLPEIENKTVECLPNN